jgi:hypothetical protein
VDFRLRFPQPREDALGQLLLAGVQLAAVDHPHNLRQMAMHMVVMVVVFFVFVFVRMLLLLLVLVVMIFVTVLMLMIVMIMPMPVLVVMMMVAVIVVMLVPALATPALNDELSGAKAFLHDVSRRQLAAFQPQRIDASLNLRQRRAGVDQGPQSHVSADAAGAIKVSNLHGHFTAVNNRWKQAECDCRHRGREENSNNIENFRRARSGPGIRKTGVAKCDKSSL